MKSDNAIIIALIVIVIVVAGVLFFMNGSGVSTNQETQLQAPANNTTVTNPSQDVSTDTQASGSGFFSPSSSISR